MPGHPSSTFPMLCILPNSPKATRRNIPKVCATTHARHSTALPLTTLITADTARPTGCWGLPLPSSAARAGRALATQHQSASGIDRGEPRHSSCRPLPALAPRCSWKQNYYYWNLPCRAFLSHRTLPPRLILKAAPVGERVCAFVHGGGLPLAAGRSPNYLLSICASMSFVSSVVCSTRRILSTGIIALLLLPFPLTALQTHH